MVIQNVQVVDHKDHKERVRDYPWTKTDLPETLVYELIKSNVSLYKL